MSSILLLESMSRLDLDGEEGLFVWAFFYKFDSILSCVVGFVLSVGDLVIVSGYDGSVWNDGGFVFNEFNWKL